MQVQLKLKWQDIDSLSEIIQKQVRRCYEMQMQNANEYKRLLHKPTRYNHNHKGKRNWAMTCHGGFINMMTVHASAQTVADDSCTFHVFFFLSISER